MSDGKNQNKRRRGIYLLPNLFTTAGLFAGFFAILAAMGERFEAAAIAIFVAMVMDGIDGRVARLTHTQSEFGAEYDSLSDMVSFGIAPALVLFEWSLWGLGKLGWMAAFVYTAAAALRLARFNTQIGVADKRYFQGLPSPSAAALMAGLVWVGTEAGLEGIDLEVVAFLISFLAGVLMVSNVRYHSFKEFDVRGRVRFVTAVVVMLIIAAISINPPGALFVIFLAYAVSGPVLTLILLRRKRAGRRGTDSAGAGRSGTEDPGSDQD